MKAPFIWFGGKRRVADVIWAALGDVDNYVEPFAGSLAVLLERPTWHTGRTETVNDADRFLANFWRALSQAPDEVARWCDWPVNEADLFARHLWLVNEGREALSVIDGDPDAFDAKVAGWWVWGLNSWIGSGWCSGNGPWKNLGGAGKGVNRKRPHLGHAGQGVNRKLPHLGDAGKGVNRKLPHLGGAGQGVSLLVPRNEGLWSYLREIAHRLRHVRVCCGDWSRVVTEGALSYGSAVGVFLDPPYLATVRTAGLYSTDSDDVAHKVRRWALEHGDDKRLRIVLAGYETEHASEMPSSWRVHAYSASAAYQSSKADGANQANRKLERLWFSPGCLAADSGQAGLFA